MRKGIMVGVNSPDRAHLEGVVADRNSPQKHVWLAAIHLARPRTRPPPSDSTASDSRRHFRRRSASADWFYGRKDRRSGMRLLTVRHVTIYRYSEPVGLGVLAGTRSDIRCLVERSGFAARRR